MTGEGHSCVFEVLPSDLCLPGHKWHVSDFTINACLSMTTVARPLSAGTTTRLVSLRSSLRAFDSAVAKLVLVDLALLRMPITWARALSVTSWGAPVHRKTSSVQKKISNLGICLGGRAKLRSLARTDVWGCGRKVDYPLVGRG